MALDGILQQLLDQPQKPEIVFVYVGIRNGYGKLDRVQPVARYYGFPEVDARAFVQTKIDAGVVKWRDLFVDDVHPNKRGRSIYAEAVTQFLQKESERVEITSAPLMPPPFKGAELATATILPIASFQASRDWKATVPPEWTGNFLTRYTPRINRVPR